MCRTVSDRILLRVTNGRDSRLITLIPGSAQCCPSPYLFYPPLYYRPARHSEQRAGFPRTALSINKASPKAAKKRKNPFLCHWDRASALKVMGLAVTSSLMWSDTLHVLYRVTCSAEHSLSPDLVFRTYTLLAKHRECS